MVSIWTSCKQKIPINPLFVYLFPTGMALGLFASRMALGLV
jgi:hypothetical protein